MASKQKVRTPSRRDGAGKKRASNRSVRPDRSKERARRVPGDSPAELDARVQEVLDVVSGDNRDHSLRTLARIVVEYGSKLRHLGEPRFLVIRYTDRPYIRCIDL